MFPSQLLRPILVLLTFCAALGCRPAESAPSADSAESRTASPSLVVDSIYPVEEEIRRFRETVAGTPTSLSGGATSRDSLVTRFVRALEERDTAALVGMLLDPAEFIHLYFPHTVYTSAPYEMDPAFIWFQMGNHSSRGLTRAIGRFGGRDLGYRGYVCGRERLEGPNILWDDCMLRLRNAGETAEIRLFGMIIMRNGHFNFVTYGNEI